MVKLNPDLIRNILLTVEDISDGTVNYLFDNPECFPLLENHSLEEVSYHIKQLNDYGLLSGVNSCFSEKGVCYYIIDLSPEGHKYLQAIKEPSIWNKTMNKIKAVGNISLPIIYEIASGFIKSRLPF